MHKVFLYIIVLCVLSRVFWILTSIASVLPIMFCLQWFGWIWIWNCVFVGMPLRWIPAVFSAWKSYNLQWKTK